MSSELFDRGIAVRRQVLGEDYVENAFAKAKGDFYQQALQEMITTVGWGAVWTRPGLERKTRSMLTLALMVGLNRPHEVAIHLRGALRNGCTHEEVREILLHCGCYCGWPAAVDAFQVVRKVMEEDGAFADDAPKQPAE